MDGALTGNSTTSPGILVPRDEIEGFTKKRQTVSVGQVYKVLRSAVKIAFIDDSSQSAPPRRGLQNLVSLGAVIFDEGNATHFLEGLTHLKVEFGIPADEEIKWKPPRKSVLARLGGATTLSLRKSLLRLARDCEVLTIVVVIDRGARYSSKSEVELGQILLKWLFERFSMLLKDYGDHGIMVADKPGGGATQEARWLTQTLAVTSYGTEYVEPGKVVVPVLTADSKHVPHLQLADMVVASTTAAVAGRSSGLALRDELRPLAHRHRLGSINGAGLVLFPDQPNLYYWALGETSWAKPSRLSGWVLPAAHLRYGSDDGLSGSEPLPT